MSMRPVICALNPIRFVVRDCSSDEETFLVPEELFVDEIIYIIGELEDLLKGRE